MQLALPKAGIQQYKSACHRARVATESWTAHNLFCANCSSSHIDRAPDNNPVIDFFCAACRAPYQLKSRSQPVASRIVDAEYNQMCLAIREDRTPNLLVMHYDLNAWRVLNLILVPRFAFSLAAIERRKPLSIGARLAGWVGCNILLSRIPEDAKLVLISSGNLTNPKLIRRQYRRIKPISAIKPQLRGWTLDTLTAIRSLGTKSFTLDDAYSLTPNLAGLHPDNHHVRDKIRQQLQILRDLRLLSFTGRGTYHLE